MRRPPHPYLHELEEIQQQVDRLFARVLGGPEAASVFEDVAGGEAVWQPAIDVVETPDRFELYVELPGVHRDDVQLEVAPRRVVVSGRRAPAGDGARFRRLERSYGSFHRVVDLPAEVDADAVAATFRQGVLRVSLSRRGSHRIDIADPEVPAP